MLGSEQTRGTEDSVAEIRILRWICKVIRGDKIQNKYLKKSIRGTSIIVKTIRKNRLKRFEKRLYSKAIR